MKLVWCTASGKYSGGSDYSKNSKVTVSASVKQIMEVNEVESCRSAKCEVTNMKCQFTAG